MNNELVDNTRMKFSNVSAIIEEGQKTDQVKHTLLKYTDISMFRYGNQGIFISEYKKCLAKKAANILLIGHFDTKVGKKRKNMSKKDQSKEKK